jgi:hypothetical protein
LRATSSSQLLGSLRLTPNSSLFDSNVHPMFVHRVVLYSEARWFIGDISAQKCGRLHIHIRSQVIS